MAAIPILEETSGSPGAAMIAGLAGLSAGGGTLALSETGTVRPSGRKLSIYPASAGFDLVDELDFLAARTVESNVFFNPRFLAPAMPRLEDREVRLAVIRDGDETRNRLRLLVPFSIERPATPLGVSILRAWSSPFGPLGTPLLDRDDPVGVIDDFFAMLSRPSLKMPKVFVMPELPLDGTVAKLMRTVAMSRDLPIIVTGEAERPILKSGLESDAYLKAALSAHHVRDFRRLKRRLSDKGRLDYTIARQPEDVRLAVEAFLVLEASGWKGRERTAMAVDRFRAAFAREAVFRLAEQDMCRVHSLVLDGKVIASLIVFIESGVAYTWKTAYDEAFAPYSPGALLMVEVTKNLLEDPNIEMADSCAVPDHPIMSRFWTERRKVGTMVVGLTSDADRAARQAATQLHLYRETRNLARLVRNRVKSLLGRG